MRRFLLVVVGLIIAMGAALWAMSTPDIPRSVLETKYATPPSQFLTLPDGARAHVRDSGPRDARVLVLVHGSNASLFTWEPWVARLDNTYRVVTLDLPGHGLTGTVPNNDYSQEGMVKFVLEVADKLGIKTFAIAGNSMGGGVVARLAEERPDRVSALILVDAGGMPTPEGSNVPFVFKYGRTPGIRWLLLHITPRSLVTDGLDKAVIHKEIINDRMIDEYWDFARMAGTREATAERFALPWDHDVQNHIGDIKAPTLILWGEKDGLIPVVGAHEFHDAIPGSKLIIYPNTGHIPQEEVPDQSAADVRAFLSQ